MSHKKKRVFLQDPELASEPSFLKFLKPFGGLIATAIASLKAIIDALRGDLAGGLILLGVALLLGFWGFTRHTPQGVKIRAWIHRRRILFITELSTLLMAAGVLYFYFFMRTPPNSFAIVPFSASPSDSMITKSIERAIYGKLSERTFIRVKNPVSAATYRGSEAPLQILAKQLHVQFVVSGRIFFSDSIKHFELSVTEQNNPNPIFTLSIAKQKFNIIHTPIEVGDLFGRIFEKPFSASDATQRFQNFNLFFRALEYLRAGSIPGCDQAEAIAKEIIGKDPGFAEGFVTVAQLNDIRYGLTQNHQSLDEMGRACRLALKADSTCVSAYQLYGHFLSLTAHEAEAVSMWYKALSINPNDAATLSDLGYSYVNRDSSLKYHIRAYNQKRYDKNVVMNVGIGYALMGQHGASRSFFQEALLLDPAYPKIWSNLGSSFERTDDIDTAITYFQKAIQLAPSSTIDEHIYLVCDLLFRNRNIEAVRSLDHDILLFGDDYRARYFLGVAYQRSGNLSLARAQWETGRAKAKLCVTQSAEDYQAKLYVILFNAVLDANRGSVRSEIPKLPQDSLGGEDLTTLSRIYAVLGDERSAFKLIAKVRSKGGDFDRVYFMLLPEFKPYLSKKKFQDIIQ